LDCRAEARSKKYVDPPSLGLVSHGCFVDADRNVCEAVVVVVAGGDGMAEARKDEPTARAGMTNDGADEKTGEPKKTWRLPVIPGAGGEPAVSPTIRSSIASLSSLVTVTLFP
jgi:hypothetical protein